MPELSLSQAAKLTGKSKSTINRAIKTGKLSATRHDDGSYSIDPAELSRAFNVEPPDSSKRSDAEPDGARLLERIEALESMLSREREISRTFHNDLRELIEKGFLKPKLPNQFWVNPALFFKGDRVAFLREYRIKGRNPLEQHKTGVIERGATP